MEPPVPRHPRRRAAFPLPLLGTFFLLILPAAGCRKPFHGRESRLTMGTILAIELEAPDAARAGEALKNCWAEAARLEKIFNRYDPRSELSRINREASDLSVAVSPEMLEVLSRALEISRLTGGAFDISVGPLLEIWGFFSRSEGRRIPAEEEIAAARGRVGWEKIDLDREHRQVRFLAPGLEIDLNALAKGYVVDRLAALLAAAGIENALINAGGDIYCRGSHATDRPWRIGIEHPRREGEVLAVLELRDRAVATSGDYRNYFIRSNQRYSHIIDPRIGRPADSTVLESTVLAPDCMTADALATALFVLGPEEGLEVLESGVNWEGIIVAEVAGRIAIRRSSGFPAPEGR